MIKLILCFLLLPVFGFSTLHAGGPWLVYQGGTKNDGGFLLINLGYDSGPQYSSTENDDDEDANLRYRYNKTTKKTEVWKITYDGDNANPGSIKNAWHRTSWGRQGNTFAVLYSQFEVLEANGVADHGVGFATGSCVLWPNRSGDIGINGRYPSTLNYQLLRLDGYWEGSALGSGSRQIKPTNVRATLDVPLTRALNLQAGLDDNAEAKDFILTWLVANRGWIRATDENRP